MAKTLFCMVGLPASGKSTRAKQMLAEFGMGNAKICNRDSLRLMLDDSKWTPNNEKFVVALRDHILGAALDAGLHAICDDTNLSEKVQARLRQIAKQHNAAFEIVDFTDVPLETCLERDSKRAASVGRSVIMDMWNKYLKPAPPVIEYDCQLPDCVTCDIDGTLAVRVDRGPFEWGKVGSDKSNRSVVKIMQDLINLGREVIFVSGRDECCREATESWLADRNLFGPLFMRPAGDMRKDCIVKQEIYEREIKGKFNCTAWFDDRPQVIRMLRSLGLPVFDVGDGVEF